jgi:hypothetical protein
VTLRTWTCDTCGELVTSARNDGLVVWCSNDALQYFGFKIVHKTMKSDPEPKRCDPGGAEGYTISLDLERFLGASGLAMMLSWLSAGPLKGDGGIQVADMDEYVDLVRRVQTPYYEEARPRFGDEKTRHWLGDANEYYPYLPEMLQRIAEGTLGA